MVSMLLVALRSSSSRSHQLLLIGSLLIDQDFISQIWISEGHIVLIIWRYLIGHLVMLQDKLFSPVPLFTRSHLISSTLFRFYL